MSDNNDNENTSFNTNSLSNNSIISNLSNYSIETISNKKKHETQRGNFENFGELCEKESLYIKEKDLKNLKKLELKSRYNGIKYDIYIFFNKNNDENENNFVYYSDYKLYICKINFKDLIDKNKIDKNKCEEIDLKEYINDKLLGIKYYYKNSKNILICKSNENILFIDIDNKDNIISIYKKEDKVNIISTILEDDCNFKILLYNKYNFTFSIYNINEKLEVLIEKEKKYIESFKDLSISFIEYYNYDNKIILIGKKLNDNKDYNFIYLIDDKLNNDDNLNNINLDESNNIKFNKEKKTIKVIINEKILFELNDNKFYKYDLSNLSTKELIFSMSTDFIEEIDDTFDFQIWNQKYLIFSNFPQIIIYSIEFDIFFKNIIKETKIWFDYTFIFNYDNKDYLTLLIKRSEELRIYEIKSLDIKKAANIINYFQNSNQFIDDKILNLINNGENKEEIESIQSLIDFLNKYIIVI